jgi:hypothetical protein
LHDVELLGLRERLLLFLLERNTEGFQ